jgi:hypothetical protein
MQRTLSLAVPFVLLAACASGEKNAEPAPDSASAMTAASAVTPPEVTIVAKDFAYEAPDSIAGGMVTLKLVNHGSTYHHVQLVRLLEGKTFTDLTEGLKHMQPGSPPPPWIEEVVGPNSPEPGGESRLIRDLAPGDYAIMCFVDTPDHVPHVMKGMIKPLTVTAPVSASAAAPASDVTVQMTDYDWSLSAPLTAGRHVLRLENLAQQSHEMFIVRLDEGKTKEDFMKWGMSFAGPPPGKAMGGTSGQRNGDVAFVPVDLAAGNYLLVCFLPDAKDGKPHLAHGMIKELTIS